MLRLNELSHKNELGPIWKILKRAFRWNQARFCGSIRLGAALDWIYMVSNDNCGTDVNQSLMGIWKGPKGPKNDYPKICNVYEHNKKFT